MKRYIKSAESDNLSLLSSLKHDKKVLETLDKDRMTETMLRNLGFKVYKPKELIYPLLDAGLTVEEVIDKALQRINKDINVVENMSNPITASVGDRQKYSVYCDNGPSRDTNYPEVAIKAWFEFEQKYPMDCAIYAYNKEDAVELVKFALSHYAWFKGLYEKYDCPYKWDWMRDRLIEAGETNCQYFLGDGEFGDQVGPFSFG